MSFITVSGVLTNALGVILPNTVLKFSAIRTSQEVLNSISIEVETNESGAYNFPLMFGVYSLSIRPKNEAAFKPVASNIVVINTNQSGTLNSLIYNQQVLQEVNEELINEMLGIQHATEVAATSAAISASNASTSATDALASKNAAAISEVNAAASANVASTSAAEALASKNAAAASEVSAASSASSALASKNSAATSEANSVTSAAEALASKNAAAISEINADTSEANALASKNAAAISETNSASSAASALASKDAAASSGANAATSAYNALTYANISVDSANSASASATSATNSAASALASKNSAAISEANSATSEAQALASKNAAAASEVNAANSAAGALNASDAAHASELSAYNSASSALNSKNAAATSEANADISEATALAYANTANSAASSATDSANSAASSASSALAFKTAAEAAKVAAENAAATLTGAMVEAGAVDMSSGNYPAPLKDSSNKLLATFWKVTVAGVASVDSVHYGVGDSVVYSNTLNAYYKIDNTESVTSVNGKQGVVNLNASEVGALPITGGNLTGPLGVQTINGQGSSIGWASLDVTGIKGGYAGIHFPSVGHWFGVQPSGLSGVWDYAGNSKWYFHENGRLGGGAVVPWNIIVDHPSRTNWANASASDVVSGQLAWKAHGNGHTIFDASASTSPDGTTVDKNNPQIAWQAANAAYPTLMGWNGINTYGVRVDSARLADSANWAAQSDRATYLNGTVATAGQDITIHGKRAMVGVGDSNQITINYANDWGSTLIQGQTYLQTVESNRHVVVHNGATTFANSGLEVRTTDGSDVRIGMHRAGHTAVALVHNAWGFTFEGTSAGINPNVAAGNFFANEAQNTNGNALTRLDYVGANFLKHRNNLRTEDGTSLDNVNREYGFNYGTGGGSVGPYISFGGLNGSYDCQLTAQYNGNGSEIKFRTHNGDAGVYNPWYTLWNSGNFDPNTKLNAAGGTLSGEIVINANAIRGANGAAIIRDHGNGNTAFSGSRTAAGTVGDLYLGYNDNANHFTNKVLLCKSMYSDANQNLQIIDYSNGALFDKGAAVIGANRDNVLNNSSFGVGFLSANDAGAQWIAGYFGKNGGSNQVVVGEISGGAVIGGHTAAKTGWADLYIGTYPGEAGNNVTHISMPHARVAGNATSYEILHRGNFNPDSKLSENGHYGGTLKLNNWFRSVGDSGWFSETHGGGIYMDEATTVKVYGGKKFYVANTEHNSIGSTGGIFSYQRMMVDTRQQIGNGGSFQAYRYIDAPFHAGHGGLDVNSFAPIVGSANYTNGHGYTTRIQLGALTPGATGWSSAALMVGSAENNAHPLATFIFSADGSMSGITGISLTGNINIGESVVCNYAYANGVQPQAGNALTRKDYVDAQDYAVRWDTHRVPNHSGGDANAHYNSEWDGSSVSNAPSASWYFFRELYHSSGSNWRHQEALDFHSDEEWFRRGIDASGYSSWRRRWHSGNFDPDSKANLSGANFTGNITAPGITVSSQIVVNNASTDSIISTGGIHVSAGLFAGTTVTGTAGVFDGVKRVFSDNNHPNFAFDRNATTTVLWTGSSSSHPTTITLPEALGNFNRVRFEGVNAGASIAWVVTMSLSELAAICNTGLLVYIASGTYSYTFNSFTTASTTLSRNTSVNGYLTKIVGIR